MAFKNENVPPLEQETSEFLKSARKALDVMYERRDEWTVDRQHDMALAYGGSGREPGFYDHKRWSFIDHKGLYVFTTKVLAKEISPEEIAITHTLLSVWQQEGWSIPDAETFASIKEALREFKDWGVVSDYKRCQLTLIDGRTGLSSEQKPIDSRWRIGRWLVYLVSQVGDAWRTFFRRGR